MKVFISWSREPSRQIALALRDWLPMVIQAVKPYMSEQDNEAGVRWEEVIARELDSTNFGIICLTPANVKAPWLHFEAGALGKAVDRGRVVPLLYKLSNADVGPPLSTFQMKTLDMNGVSDTVTAINQQMDEPVDPVALSRLFRLAWPELEERLKSIPEQDPSTEPAQRRTDRQLLEEILELVRSGTQVSELSRLLAAIRPSEGPQPDIAQIMRQLREIVGPDGFIESLGKDVILRGSKVASLGKMERKLLDNITEQLKGHGVNLLVTPPEEGRAPND